MNFDWEGYLILAKDLKSQTDGKPYSNLNDAKQRTAISRAYYSMFHLAEDYAKKHFGYVPKTGGPNQAHSDVRLEYQKRLSNPDHQEIKTILFRMHKARVNSDYDSNSLGNVTALLSSIILDADKIKATL